MIKKIDLKVGYLCNNHCMHCAIEQTRNDLIKNGINTELTTETIKSLMHQYSKQYNSIVLTGGEITIRKDFLDLLQYASQMFEHVDVQTNGRKLGDKHNINVLSSLNNVSYAIALHGSNSQIHDKITQVKHSFDQTINSIKTLTSLANKPDITIKFVLTNYNKHNVLETVKLCKNLNVNKIDIAFVHGCTDDLKILHGIIPSYGEIKQCIEQSLEFGDTNNIKISLESFPLCTVSPNHFNKIDEIVLDQIDVGCRPVNDDQFDWNYERVMFNKSKRTVCDNCLLHNNCEGPWKEYWSIHGIDGINPVAANNKILPIIKENKAVKLKGYIDLLVS